MSNFKTIRQTASLGFINENYIRNLVAQGKCPGIYSGNRFLVNVDALIEQLDKESKKNTENCDNI